METPIKEGLSSSPLCPEKVNFNTVAAAYRRGLGLLSDVDVSTVLAELKKETWAAKACFWRYEHGEPVSNGRDGGKDYELVKNGLPKKDAIKTIVMLSYENPKGAGGGVKVVVEHLPKQIREHLEASGLGDLFNSKIWRISPLHSNLASKYKPEELNTIGECEVPFDGKNILTQIFEVNIGGESWILFGAPGFFEADGGQGGTDPYIYSHENQLDRDGDNSKLLLDSLFAARAIPEILIHLKLTENIVVQAHDWEFACAAITIKDQIIEGRIKSAAQLLTIHNPYDHGLSESNLSRISSRHRSEHWPTVGEQGRPTVLTRMIPLLDGPPSVVSHNFAKDLRKNPQQTGIFTRHQQGVLNYTKPPGIDNGNFIKVDQGPFSERAVTAARQGYYELILAEKITKRNKMLADLDSYMRKLAEEPDPLHPVYGTLYGDKPGSSLTSLSEDVPVFMMVGRLDPGQKGYDVAARVIESVPRGYGRFVFTPMSSLANDPAVKPFMNDLISLAESRKGEVVVFAHRMKDAYGPTMAGATWSLWPSLYEPFGGANEFYSLGTPVIAHAVGGLVQQVIGYNDDPENATGFLYHEPDLAESYGEREEQYKKAHSAMPRERMLSTTYSKQVISLATTIAEATSIWRYKPDLYAKMLANLYDMYLELGWKKPVNDYLAWYQSACA